ncbi:hypothetical protein KJ966_16580 [bacterium]|nr:hypothetical protein [bacterium]
MFFSFDLGIEISAVLGVLIALIACQVYLLVKRTRVRRQHLDNSVSRAANVLKTLKSSSEKTSPDLKMETGIPSNVFSEFQRNVDRADKGVKPLQKSEEGAEDDVIVSISTKASQKNPYKKPVTAGSAEKKSPPVLKPSQKLVNPSSKTDPEVDLETAKKLSKDVSVEPIGSLFDDVRESLETQPTSTETSPSTKENSSKEQEYNPDQPIISNEFLTSEDLEIDSGGTAEGIELALLAATHEFKQGNYENSLATIRQFLQDNEDKPTASEQMRRLVELKGENEFELEQYNRASKTLQTIFSRFITKNSPDFLLLLETYIKKFTEKNKHKHAVHFMFTALNEYRQIHDHVKMDQVYEEIETAYRELEDWPRLIQTLQNHLTIRKALKDFKGQLELLDHLGKLLYDQGEEDKSRKCYEQRLVIENEMAKAIK